MSRASFASWVFGITAALLAPRAYAAPSAQQIDGTGALVDLSALWRGATGDVPLSTDMLARYLTVVSTGTPTLPPPPTDPGVFLPPIEFALKPLARAAPPPRAAGIKRARLSAASSAFLPVIQLSDDDATMIYRRKPALLRYLKSHGALQALLAKQRAELAEKTADQPAPLSAEALHTFSTQVAAAEIELFLMERLAFVEGETQDQKCAARRRADSHALALRLERSDAVGQLHDDDFPPAWRGLWAFAKEHYAKQHAPFNVALCSVAEVVSRRDVRAQLEAKLNERLLQTLHSHFENKQKELGEIQRKFALDLANHVIAVPSGEVEQLRKSVEDASAIYQLVKNDDQHLNDALVRLEKATAELAATDSDPHGPSGVFAQAEHGLADERVAVGTWLSAARGLAAIPTLSSSDRARLTGCAKLPNALPDALDAALVSALDGCIHAGLQLRQDLLDASAAAPERAALMKQIESLGAAYLIVNHPPDDAARAHRAAH